MSGPLAPRVVLLEDRACARHVCEVPTTCQPPSAWCKDPWPATIRAISTAGLSLTLARRFERGSGLAIELPQGGSTETVLARVVQVMAHAGGGWLLACEFISELSDEEVQRVLLLDPLHQATLSDGETPSSGSPARSISGVLFHARAAPGEYLRWYVKRLDLSGSWPLAQGKIVSLSVPDLTGKLDLRVKSCQLFGSYWIVECRLKNAPSNEMLRALAAPNQEAPLAR